MGCDFISTLEHSNVISLKIRRLEQILQEECCTILTESTFLGVRSMVRNAL